MYDEIISLEGHKKYAAVSKAHENNYLKQISTVSSVFLGIDEALMLENDRFIAILPLSDLTL